MVRAATVGDQAAIHRIVRSAGINPFDLHWSRFVVAERDGAVVGTGQIKVHADGSRELASIAVTPRYRNAGVARTLIETLIAREPGPLYLFCRSELAPLYAKFGFRRIGADEAPPYFARIARIGAVMSRLGRWLRLARLDVAPVVMMRNPTSQTQP